MFFLGKIQDKEYQFQISLEICEIELAVNEIKAIPVYRISFLSFIGEG